MSMSAWKRLQELEDQIKKDFTNDYVCTKGCELEPRVHLVYAHYAARPAVEKNVADKWYFATLEKYKACSETTYQKAALDYLGAHYLWALTTDVKIDSLDYLVGGQKAVPPTKLPVDPTDVDGGTLVHFENTIFYGVGDIVAKIVTPVAIQDKTLIEQYGDTVPEKSHPPVPADADGQRVGPPQVTDLPSTPDRSGGDVEAGAGEAKYPKRRRFCLSFVGEVGEHEDVDVDTGTTPVELAYHKATQDSELRLFCVSPGFKFTLLPGGATREVDRGVVDGGAVPPTVTPADVTRLEALYDVDAWGQSTRTMGNGTQIYEVSSKLVVGNLVSSRYGDGVMKSAHAPGVTTTEKLAETYAGQLGHSRQLLFKAVWDIEGACESVATYDGPKLSWGINQWIASKGGEIYQILAFIYDFFPDAFARRFAYYGLGIWFKSRKRRFDPRATYDDVIFYRVPCCGGKVRAGLDAVLKGALAVTAAGQDDLPPPQKRPLAAALQVDPSETTSLAMCYVFTAAGADPAIQKAMAQWMSYRISSTHPIPDGADGPEPKTLLVVITEFLHSLGSNVPDSVRNGRALSALGAQDPDEKWSDDDADLAWIDWETRCTDAGKSMVGPADVNQRAARAQPAAATPAAQPAAGH